MRIQRVIAGYIQARQMIHETQRRIVFEMPWQIDRRSHIPLMARTRPVGTVVRRIQAIRVLSDVHLQIAVRAHQPPFRNDSPVCKQLDAVRSSAHLISRYKGNYDVGRHRTSFQERCSWFGRSKVGVVVIKRCDVCRQRTGRLNAIAQFIRKQVFRLELGYRVQATSSLSADIATFYNNYSNLRTAEPGAPFLEGSPVPTDIVVPFVAGNKMGGGTYGVELFADWRVVPKWRLVGSYSYLQMNIRKNANSLDPTNDSPNGSSPRHQWYLRSSIDLPKHFEQDTTLRFVDHVPSLNLPNYYSLDAHLGWRPVTSLELSIGGQNLLDNRHLEFMPDFVNTSPTVVKRSIFGSITVKF